jgi:hypothetical protein
MSLFSDYWDITPAGWLINKATEATVGPAALNASNQAADIEAINLYFLNEKPNNAQAIKLKDEWVEWYSSLGFFDKATNANTAANAFNKRNEMFRVNAQSQAEKDMAENMIRNGPTVNPVTGQPILRTSTGDRALKPEPLIPTTYKVAGVIGAAGVLVIVVLKKLRLL